MTALPLFLFKIRESSLSMQPLRNILKEFIKDFGIEGGAALAVIRRQWIDIVGQTVAIHTFPDTIRKKVLTIIVDTPQWMHHLSFFKEDISEKLTSYDIESIRFRLGRLPQKTEMLHKENDITLSDEDLRFLENTVKHVKDEELREKFKKLISHGLTKGKYKKK